MLCVNGGSSSLKASVYLCGEPAAHRAEEGTDPALELHVLVQRVGGDATLTVSSPSEGTLPTRAVQARDQVQALDAVSVALADALGDAGDGDATVDAVAHRIVHGGSEVLEHTVLDEHVLAQLEAAVPFAPLHLPGELELLSAARSAFGAAAQVICLDTAFHRHLAPVARRLPLPGWIDAAGIRRFGFHGLSYEYLVHRLGGSLGRRAVLAHLGNGSSMAAVLDGVGVDTTMGFTPTGGLVMGSRTGDLDPGVLVHLLRRGELDADALERLVDRESGLLGVSGLSGDVRDLMEVAGHNADAGLALELYESSAAKHVAALSTTLGGLDTLVFTAGIGEHAAPVRAAIVERIAHLGVRIDDDLNEHASAVISAEDSAVTVRVEPTNEELMMAMHAAALLDSRDG